MRCHLPDATLNEANVFRVGSERAVYPADYVEATLLPTPPGKTEWVTLNVYARELVEVYNPEAFPPPPPFEPLPFPRNQVINTGYASTQIRATFNIDNERILVGIGAGVRLSVPANSDVTVGIAIPGVPRNAYPGIPNWPNNPLGVQVQVGAEIAPQTVSPFPMPFVGFGEPALAAYTTTILATMKTCRVPVGDRLARLSQEVWTAAIPGRGGSLFALVEIPSRARKLTIYDTAPAVPIAGRVYGQFRGGFFVDALGGNTPDGSVIATLYPQTMIQDFTVPTNATHILIDASTGGEVPQPAKVNLTWTLEF